MKTKPTFFISRRLQNLKCLLLAACCLLFSASLFAQITREQADAIVFEHIQNEAIPHYFLYVNVTMPSAGGITLITHNEEIVEVMYACWVYYLNEHPEVFEPTQHRYLFVKEEGGNLLEVITYSDLGPANLSTQWLIVNPSDDATLNTLSVSEGELEPEFQSDIYEYSVNVANNVEEITIMATPNNPNATVIGTDSFLLNEGENIFTVTVTAEDGTTELSYTITINRSVNVKDFNLSKIYLYPNPTTGQLSIVNCQLSINSVEIFDVYGRKCHVTRDTYHENNIDISHLKQGIYFVKIEAETGIITKKIIKINH